MPGRFTFGKDVEHEQIEWGIRSWLSLPANTGTKHLVLVEVDLMPGFGHNFHIHPNQEELIYVISGELDQWLEQKHETLKSGDTAFIPQNTVHASFNISDKPVKFLAVLGPAVGPEGYELVDVSDRAPWSSIR